MNRSSMVHLEAEGPIGIVTLNRPDALNAISSGLADDLAGALKEVSSRPDIWVMILRGAGDRAFCVGADLKERAAFELQDFHSNRKRMRTMFGLLRSVPQPTIASVFGVALGGGFELALSCDLIVAAEETTFGLPEVRVGLLPAGGAMHLLPRAVGTSRAKEMILTGRRFDSEEAERIGLVARVVAREDLDQTTMQIARHICESSPTAVREAKRAVDSAFGTSVEEAGEIEQSAWERVVVTDDRREGIAAFNEKRDPRWQNR